MGKSMMISALDLFLIKESPMKLMELLLVINSKIIPLKSLVELINKVFQKQGILVPDRVRLLLNENSGGYRMARTGERKRRSVRGCIVSRDISVCNMIIAKRGKEPIPDLT